MSTEPRPLLSRLLGKGVSVERQEAPAVIVACLLYFCLFAGYFAVRPVRETVGTIIGAQRVSNLWILTWIASIGIIPAYGALCARFRRQAFLPWIYGFVALALGACGAAFLRGEANIAVGQFFYVLISVLIFFIVSVFWSFLLELFDSAQTKRLFGVIAAGGTAGALAGPVFTTLLVGRIGNSGILFFGSGMFVLAIVCQRILLRIWKHAGLRTDRKPVEDRPMGGNVFAGVWLVLKSPYLLGIAVFVILLSSVTTFLYFEQLALVQATFKDTVARTRVFSQIDATVQSLTIVLQVFFTGRMASRWGVGALLTIVPIVMIGGMLFLATVHTFAVLAIVMVVRRVGEYAFIRPGREMLYANLDTETKYKAKNFIDVPVYRGGDVLVAQLTNLIREVGWSPALVGAGCSVAWLAMGRWLGKQRDRQGTTEVPLAAPKTAG
jgi:AAA family ATP:ADP antiporter